AVGCKVDGVAERVDVGDERVRLAVVDAWDRLRRVEVPRGIAGHARAVAGVAAAVVAAIVARRVAGEAVHAEQRVAAGQREQRDRDRGAHRHQDNSYAWSWARSRTSPLAIRDLTVPTGIASRRAISRHDRPSKYASSSARRWSLVSTASAPRTRA